jgi:hypothetical protein
MKSLPQLCRIFTHRSMAVYVRRPAQPHVTPRMLKADFIQFLNRWRTKVLLMNHL